MITSMDVLPIVNSRLRLIDGTQDPDILSYIDEMGLRILHYCGIKSVPDGLLYVWASMTMDAVRVELSNVEEIDDTVGVGAPNVKVGDTSVSGGSGSGKALTNTAKAVIDEVVLNYRVDLNRYRKMRW